MSSGLGGGTASRPVVDVDWAAIMCEDIRLLFAMDLLAHRLPREKTYTPEYRIFYQSVTKWRGNTRIYPPVRKEAHWPLNILNDVVNTKIETVWPAFHRVKEKQRKHAAATRLQAYCVAFVAPAITYCAVRRGIPVPREIMQSMRNDRETLSWLKSRITRKQWESFIEEVNRGMGLWDKLLRKNMELPDLPYTSPLATSFVEMQRRLGVVVDL
ncbi:hypothetical protein PWT90_05157 [Aphanocladium album]|nr:hypothetical protein PWT90_05157 [Aphanocladium album]